MQKKEKLPEFRFDALLTSMREGVDHAAGKITARSIRVHKRPVALSGSEIADIRKNLNVSQTVFAELLNVPKATAVAWERGLRSPSGAALRLLHIARDSPNVLVSTF